MPRIGRVIGIVGSRRRDSAADLAKCMDVFDKVYQPGDRIVSGGCPKGGDRFAEIIAKKLGLTITIHYPDWSKHGRGAGIVRNSEIARDCHILIALVHPDRTGGTEDTVRKAIKLKRRIIYA